jgi:hypothetical protein
MLKPKFKQNSYEYRATPTSPVKYRIETSLTDKGELPREQVFVYQVVDATDASTDEFLRVCAVSDLENYPIRREEAIAGDGVYLASFFAVEYDALNDAVQARELIESRLNDLVNNYLIYRDQLRLNNLSLRTLPTALGTVEQSLIDDYVAARDARVAAEAALVTAEATLEEKEKDLETAQEFLDIRRDEKDFCSKTNQTAWPAYRGSADTVFNHIKSATDSMRTALEQLIGDVSSLSLTLGYWPYSAADKAALASESTAWITIVDGIEASEALVRDQQTIKDENQTILDTEFTNFCQNASSYHTQALQERNTADTDYASAASDKNEKTAGVDSAQKLEDAALAEITALCPAFDPSSV